MTVSMSLTIMGLSDLYCRAKRERKEQVSSAGAVVPGDTCTAISIEGQLS